jgi:hypothetical protein
LGSVFGPPPHASRGLASMRFAAAPRPRPEATWAGQQHGEGDREKEREREREREREKESEREDFKENGPKWGPQNQKILGVLGS